MTSSQSFISTLRREVGRIREFPAYWLSLTLLPALAITLFATLFHQGSPHELPIALLNQDNSTLSRQLATMIDASPEIDIRHNITDTEQGRELILEGEADAMVVIPSSFERDIYSLSQTSIEAYISGLNILKNGLISKGLLSSATTFNIGTSVLSLQSQGVSQEQAMALTMPIQLNTHILFNPYTNYSYYLSPLFMPMMIVIFTMLATIFSLGSELRYATLQEWLSAAQGSLTTALAAKLTPIFCIMVGWEAIIFSSLFYAMGIPLNGNGWMIAIAGILLIVCYMALAVVTVILTTNMRLALSLGGGYSVMAFSLSGLTFPRMAMHTVMQNFGALFPFTYFTDIVIDQILRGAPAANSIGSLCKMILFLPLAIVLAPRLRKIATNNLILRKS